MSRDAALVATWTRMTPGREAKSMEAFMDLLMYIGKQAAEGRCSEPETWYSPHGSGGMTIVRGRSDVLLEIRESEEFARLLAQGALTTDGLRIELWYPGFGEEGQRLMENWLEAARELGYM